MKIVLRGSEIDHVINALDLYSRIWIGQYDHIMYEMRWRKTCDEIDRQEKKLIGLFMAMREITLPELNGYDFCASHGIFSSERDVKAAVAYDLQQEMRYKKAWFEKPEGGYTVDFNTPIPCEDDPYPFPEAFCRTEKEMTVLETEMTAGQSDIIINAFEIQCCIENGDFKKVFSYYTEDERALGYAQRITDIYSQIPISRYYQGKTNDLRNLSAIIEKQIAVQKALSELVSDLDRACAEAEQTGWLSAEEVERILDDQQAGNNVFRISEKTLSMMDQSMTNLQNGITSTEVSVREIPSEEESGKNIQN